MSKLTYSQYKPSKVLWQNDIPSHWQETDLRMVFSENKVKNEGLIERNLLSLSYGKLKRKDIDNATGLVPASFEGYQILENGYIVLRFTDLQNDKKSLRVGYCNERGIITNAYVAIAPKEKTYPKYYYYLLHFLDTIKYFYNLGGGVRQSLSFKEFARETILVPKRDEQIRIAAFLDYKLTKITLFIRKKKQLIKLLNEQKSAIMNQAVTKGLVPNAKMKPSGINWLGDIPEHWEIRRLRYLAKVKTGRTPKIESSSINYFEQGIINWFTPGDFGKEGFLVDAKRKVHESAITNNQIELFPSNTVYLVGIGGTIGKVGICETEGSSNQQINAIIFNNIVNSQFGFYSLKSSKHQIYLLANYTTLPILNQAKTKEIIIPCPMAPDEQKDIVEFIESESLKINKTIITIKKEIALTREYRTAIIAEAVTGKIDVRDYNIPKVQEEETYEDLEEGLSLAAEDTAEYQNQE